MNSPKAARPLVVKRREKTSLGLKENFLRKGSDEANKESKEERNSQSFREKAEVHLSLVSKKKVRFVNQVFNSIFHTPEIDADVERFIDLFPKIQETNSLGKLPFWGEFVQHCYSPLFVHPKVTIPIKTPLFPLMDKGDISFRKIFLGVAVTFTCLRSFERKGPQRFEDIPTHQWRSDQILSLGVALFHVQESFLGVIDGQRYKGLDFLSTIAERYGVKIIPDGEGGVKFVKGDRFHRDWGTLLPFLRRYSSALEDLSAFVGQILWCHSSVFSFDRMTVREGMLKCLKFSSAKDAGSILNELGDEW